MIRMWAVHPKVMCRKHLMEEHNNLHKFVGMINKDTDLSKYREERFLDPKALPHRHGLIIKEFQRRGIKHTTPLSSKDINTVKLDWNDTRNKLDSYKDINEMYDNCKQCRRRIDK